MSRLIFEQCNMNTYQTTLSYMSSKEPEVFFPLKECHAKLGEHITPEENHGS